MDNGFFFYHPTQTKHFLTMNAPSPSFCQNEKCHLLIEHETQKLKELDEEHSLELKEWREKLRPRKKVQHSGDTALTCYNMLQHVS